MKDFRENNAICKRTKKKYLNRLFGSGDKNSEKLNLSPFFSTAVGGAEKGMAAMFGAEPLL